MDQRELINRILPRQTYFLLSLLTLVVLIACKSPEERELSQGLELVKTKDFKAALKAFQRTILRNPQSPSAVIAAKEGARVALLELKDFQEAAIFFREIVIYSNDVNDRVVAQKQLAQIYFDQLTDYPKAIEELNKLLATGLDVTERKKFRIRLAKAYFFTNNFVQSESEVLDFLKNEKQIDDDSLFQMTLLKGNIYLAKKEQVKAIEVFRGLMKSYPERSVKENAAMTLAVAYEELKDYKNAIDVLQQIKQYHSTPEYIELKISKLISDQKNLPGAKGMHRK